MRERQDRQIETLGAIVRFLRKFLFTHPRAQHLKEELLAHYERVMELVTENRRAKAEPRHRRGYRRISKDSLRAGLLLPLARRSRKLSRVYPELELALKVPHKNASVAQIADAAERMADALTPHLRVLIRAKYPRNCLDMLRRDARALREQAEATVEARGLLNRSNRELTEELSLARDRISELDAVLRSLDNYSTYAADWRHCNRVGARMGRPTKRRLAARERSAARRSVEGNDTSVAAPLP
jgi:hypothetical protein